MGKLANTHNIAASRGTVTPLHSTLPRKSIEQALNDASLGRAPQNPHNDPELLKAEAIIANETFHAYLRSPLRIAIGAPHHIEGPEKDIQRALAKKGKAGDNCDWARHSILLNNMRMAQLATDMLHRRGVLSLKTCEGFNINMFVVDTENSFIEDSSKKPGLRMINTKLLVPISLADGTSTYHVLELRAYLAASEKAYQESELFYKEYRDKSSLAKAYETAVNTARTGISLRLKRSWENAEKDAESALEKRTRLNMEDAERNGANALLGYEPDFSAKNPKWSFQSFEDFAKRNCAPELALQRA